MMLGKFAGVSCMTENDKDGAGNHHPRFMDKSYQEAIDLTFEVANYFERQIKSTHKEKTSVEIHSAHVCESMRLSSCLMQVVSWFLIQKGVDAEEITKSDAAQEKYRLGGKKAFALPRSKIFDQMAPEFKNYLEQTEDLYRRVERLDKMLYGEDADQNPVHHMMEKFSETD